MNVNLYHPDLILICRGRCLSTYCDNVCIFHTGGHVGCYADGLSELCDKRVIYICKTLRFSTRSILSSLPKYTLEKWRHFPLSHELFCTTILIIVNY